MGKGTVGKAQVRRKKRLKARMIMERTNMSLFLSHVLDKTWEFSTSLLTYKALSLEE